MQISISKIATTATQELKPALPVSKTCREILEEYGLSYKEVGPYLEVGEPKVEGWVLHIGVIRLQFTPLLKAILPLLIESKVSFKIPRDKDTAKSFVDGRMGYTQLGKTICVYPENELTAAPLAARIIELTKEFRSPKIPTDKHLGGTVFASYESPEVPLTIPFSLPHGVEWPFAEIKSLTEPKKKPLLNYRYKLLSIMKADIKGRVIKGNYFKSLLNIKLCVIKEGIKDMWADQYGRDIVDRLKWQYELYKDLEHSVPTPKIFDFFQEDDNSYLAIEYIKGDSLGTTISALYNENSYQYLPHESRLLIIDYFQKILSIIEKLHSLGYAHRDITPENFIVTKSGKIYLIDMELTYSVVRQFPSPAFGQGTAGYMSPEQEMGKKPTLKEDIYAIGSLIFFCFTGLSPIKLDQRNQEKLLANLIFLTGSEILSSIIKNCMSKDPDTRPSIPEIRSELDMYRKQALAHKYQRWEHTYDRISSHEITEIINKALNALSSRKIMTEDYIWTSQVEHGDLVGIKSSERSPQIGFHTGISGILYTIALAKRLGYNVDSCMQAYQASWSYVKSVITTSDAQSPSGLFDGLAGVALALNEGINSGLISSDDYAILPSLFTTDSPNYRLATGIPGQGIALLKCQSNIPVDIYKGLLDQYVAVLCSSQQKDGSWPLYRNSGRKNDNHIGLANGTAGVILFLLRYYQNTKSPDVLDTISKGLHWLTEIAKKQNDLYFWTTSTKSKSVSTVDISLGTPGVTFVFIEAYDTLKYDKYKQIAESALMYLPEQPISNDYSWANGLAGIANLYLEAFRVLRSNEWRQRADWIMGLFKHSFVERKTDLGYWAVNIFEGLEPDLFSGVGGIIRLLLLHQCQTI